MQRVFILIFAIFFIPVPAFSDISDKAMQCIKAAKCFSDQGDVRSFIKQKYTFVGQSGNNIDFDCIHDISIIMFIEGSNILGYFSYNTNPKNRINFRGKWYSNDSLYLEEVTKEGLINFTFKGTMKNGKIEGVWSKGQDKKGFSFYASRTE